MWRDALKDLLRLELLPVKAAVFFVYGGQYTLLPFFAVIFKSFGFDIESISIIYAIQPIASLIASFVSGALKRPCRIKLVVCVLLVLAAVSNSLLLLIKPKPLPLLRFHVGSTDTNFTIRLTASPERCSINFTRSTLHLDFRNCDKAPVLSNGSELSLLLDKDTFSLDVVGNDFVLDEPLHNSPNLNFIYNETSYNELNFDTNITCDVSSPVDKKLCEGMDIGRLLHTLLLVALATGFSSLAVVLIESAVVRASRLSNSDVGLQRIWSFFGAVVWPLIAALLVELTGSLRTLFYLYDALMLVGLSAVVFIDAHVDYEPLSLKSFKLKDKLGELRSEAPMFFAVVVLGATWGFIDAFLFWYMEELSSGFIWMSLSVSLGAVGSVLFCLCGDRLRRLGEGSVALLVAAAVYCIRFVGYIFGNSALVCVGVAILEPLTSTNLMLSLSRFCDPGKGRRRRIMNLASWSSVHLMSGRILGAPIGAYGIASFGTSLTFRYWAYPLAALAVVAVLLETSRNVVVCRRKQKSSGELTVADGLSAQSQTKPPSPAWTACGALSIAAVTRTWMADVVSASNESWSTSTTGVICSSHSNGGFDEDGFQKDLLELRQSRLHTYVPNVFSRSLSMPAVPSRNSVSVISRQRMSLPPVLEEPSVSKPEGRPKTRLAAPPEAFFSKGSTTEDRYGKGESTMF